MNNLSRFNTMAMPSVDWVKSDIGTLSVLSTTSAVHTHVVMVQGKTVTGRSGYTELLVSIDPASLVRKLAVMRVSAELDGRVVTSTAAPL